jgi:hypothetical protein
VLAFAVLVPPARADDHRHEYVPELDAYHKLSKGTRLFLLADATKVDFAKAEFAAKRCRCKEVVSLLHRKSAT